MAGIRDIKRQIKSIGNTRKITKAMEMVAAAKMRKAVEAVLRTRTYANLSWETVLHLAKANGKNGNSEKALHPLLAKRTEIHPVKSREAGTTQDAGSFNGARKVLIILISSNRGLCGGFNAALINKAVTSIKKHGQSTDFMVMGKKARAVYKYFGYNIAAEFEKEDISIGVSEAIPLAKMAIADFLTGKYDKVMVAYTDFISATKQLPRVRQLLPVEVEKEDKYLGVVGKDTRVGLDEKFVTEKKASHLTDDQYIYEYTFEPSPEEVLNQMIPRLVEVQLFQAILESNAAEHSARMAAMHQATEAATDMIADLTLTYNKARQAGITREIAEISAGAEALKG